MFVIGFFYALVEISSVPNTRQTAGFS